MSGQANLRNAALDMGLPLSFTDTNGEFALLGAKVLLQQLAGRAGGGEFHIGGKIHLVHGPELSWSLHDVGLTFPAWLEERISGKGRVDGTWKVLTVSGDIDVLNVLYDKKIELTGLIPWFKEQITPAPRIGPPTTEVQLDLRIHARDGVFVDNNFAKTELSADLRVSGAATKPVARGQSRDPLRRGDGRFAGLHDHRWLGGVSVGRTHQSRPQHHRGEPDLRHRRRVHRTCRGHRHRRQSARPVQLGRPRPLAE